MPIIKSARKKLKQDKKRGLINLRQKKAVISALRDFKNKPTNIKFGKLTSLLDSAAKKNIFHKNKTARLKKRLSRLLKRKTP